MSCFKLPIMSRSLNEPSSNGDSNISYSVINGTKTSITSRDHYYDKTSELDLLDQRLKVLEEEAAAVKQRLVETAKEKTELMNAIFHHFRVIHHRIDFIKQPIEEESDNILIGHPHKMTRAGTGLSQVLNQQSNPSIVIGDLKLTKDAFKHILD